jgi:catechol 2,3-dioxygenase-like lactoylglutathione lyase family enzyme
MSRPRNTEFDMIGINHLALVCKDMARTVDFYTNVLGMPLIKTLNLPGGMGQHFFFDVGNGDSIAFFWFPGAPEAVPGISSPAHLPTSGKSIATAHGSMNHVAINIPADKVEEYHAKLIEKGVKATIILNHDNSPGQVSREMTDDVYVRSIYFFDPDGIMLEFAAWTKEFTAADVAHEPVSLEKIRDKVTAETA